jgi:ABC-type transport system involved in multi-copper enzyme maturation permease subunit
MNALVRKEIRLVSPVWLLVLALELVWPWLHQDLEAAVNLGPIGLFFGLILLAVDPWGREFFLGTFSHLLSQPLERRQLWRAKISVLCIGAAAIFLVWLASYSLRLRLALADPGILWHANPKLIWDELGMAVWSGLLLFFVALSGGLWTALLFRQIAAAFWISFLAPVSLFMAMEYFLPSSWEQNRWVSLAIRAGAAAIYSGWGFWLAHRLFHRAQDAGWTGGVISFSRWRYFESAAAPAVSLRQPRALRALFRKELQLQSITWFCAAAVLGLHASVIVMRMVHGPYVGQPDDSLARLLSEFFWAVWLILPLIIGCTAVAEERRLTVTESQFCQPVSRRVQFLVKFVPTMVSGIILGGVMPALVEGIAFRLGAPNQDFNFQAAGFISLGAISVFAAVLVFTAAYASTLVTTFLQAMGLSVVLVVGGAGFGGMILHARSLLGLSLNPPVTMAVAIVTGLILVPWLTFRNYRQLETGARIWRRNAVTLALGAGCIWLASSALYNRAWEVFEPDEPAHGPAKLSLSTPPVLRETFYGMLCVRLPDGQFWFDRLDSFYSVPSRFKRMWQAIADPLPYSVGPHQFVSGSNWVSVTTRFVSMHLDASELSGQYGRIQATTNHIAGYLDTIGIQRDGTLWLSKSDQGQWNGNSLDRFGTESDWKQVIRVYPTVLLLKRDGTLWRWGEHPLDWSQWPPQWPTLQTHKLRQVGTNADWAELISVGRILARKTDGSVWDLYVKGTDVHFSRDRHFDSASFQTLSVENDNAAYIRPDGTLWASVNQGNLKKLSDFRQVGTGTHWVAARMSFNRLVALKSDGTLWVWQQPRRAFDTALDEPPKSMSIHHDWVALTGDWSNVITLAADGSLWLWPDRAPYNYYSTPLKLPKQPKRLGNISTPGK